MTGLDFIRDIAVVLLIAGLAGWLCRYLGMSVVVGYLVAGMVIGPYTPPFQLVTDLDRVQMLAQFGLVFLMFSVGLGLSLGRLQRLGLSVAVATAVGAILLWNLSRALGVALGWPETSSLLLAGMVMVSSSAIISKVLEEQNATHEPAGQLALGITVLEDIVAVVMLTLLTSVIQVGGMSDPALGSTLGRLAAFVVFLLLLSLLLVPRLLRWLDRGGSGEIQTLLLCGLVLSLGWIAAWVGYSLALGAFVLGAVVSGTRFRIEIERRFDPLKHTFGAIFFVAIGMLFDLRLLVEAWPMILGITLLVLIFRPLACALGLLSVGNSSRDALRAGLSLTPIGEFSLVMAQVGTASAVVPEKFYALAVGLCLTTSLTAPWITRNRDVVADVIIRLQPGFLAQWLLFYQEQLAHLYSLRGSSSLWRLTRGRLIQIAMHFLFISALLLASGPINRWLLHRFGEDWLVPHGISIGFWLVFGLGLLAPLISLWRNLEAVCMLLADGSTAGYPRRSVVRPLFESALKVVSALVLAIWFVSLLPVATASVWSLVIAALLLVLPGIYFHRRLLRWHSRVEFELKEEFASASNAGASAGLQLAFLKRPEEWNMEIHEVTLPAETAHAGKSIGDLALRTRAGCSIVGMDRQGFIFNNPRAADCVYPGDRLLLLGSPQQLAEADRFLIGPAKATVPAESFGELTTETLEIPASWPTSGRTLRQLNLMQRFRVQVGGISRKQKRIVVPTGTDRVLPGDRLLVLGTYGRIQECRQWLSQAVREDIDEEGLADEPEN